MADVPRGLSTVTFTVPVPAGLIAVRVVSLTTVTSVAAVVPKSTPVSPIKPVPMIVTNVPPARRTSGWAQARNRRRGMGALVSPEVGRGGAGIAALVGSDRGFVAGKSPVMPAAMAGLVGIRAKVSVGPPLASREPSIGIAAKQGWSGR